MAGLIIMPADDLAMQGAKASAGMIRLCVSEIYLVW